MKEIDNQKRFRIPEIKRHLENQNLLADELLKIENEYHFKNQAEEIEYYKYSKPEFIKYGLYLREIYEIAINMPPGFEGDKIAYLQSQMDQLKLFFTHHKEYFAYFKSESTYRDSEIFNRNSKNRYIFALILASMMLEKYLQNERDPRPLEDKLKDFPRTKWKGTIIEAVELLYALALSQSIEHESNEMKQMAKDFEIMFGVNLGNHYRKFLDIKNRYEPTKFIDHLQEVLRNHIAKANNNSYKK